MDFLRRKHRVRRRRFEFLEARHLLAANASGDDFPNVPIDDPCLIANDQSVTGELEVLGDSDVFAFDVLSGEVVHFEVSTSDLASIRLDVIPKQDVSPFSGIHRLFATSFDTSLRWEAASTSRLFVRVSSQTHVGGYSLSMSSVHDVPDEVNEFTPELVEGVPFGAEFELAGDVDVYALPSIGSDANEIDDGDTVTVRITRGSIPFYPQLRVVTDRGRPVAKTLGDQLSFNASPFQSYFVQVSSELTSSYSMAGTYELAFETTKSEPPSVPTRVPLDESTPAINFGETVSGELQNGWVHDVYAFEAIEGQLYEFRSNDDRNPELRIFGNADDELTTTRLFDGRLVWRADSTARHYIDVTLQSSTESYSFVVDVVTPTRIDEGAFSAVAGEQLMAFSFEAQADAISILEFGFAGHVTIRSASDLQFIQTTGIQRDANATTLVIKAPVSGDYLALVTNSTRHPMTEYDGSLSVLPHDDFPNGIATVSTMLTRNSDVNATISPAFDQDAFAIDLLAGEVLQLRLRAEGFSANLTLQSTDGNVVAFAEDDGRITYHASESGRYIAVVGGRDDQTGDYQLFSESTFDLHGDSSETTTSNITTGVEVEGSLEWHRDRDVFSLDAQAGEVIQLTANTEGFHIEVMDPEGGYVSFHHVSRTVCNFETDVAGRYYVVILPDSIDEHSTADYAFSIERLSDEPDSVADILQGPSPANMTFLDELNPVTGAFETRNDADVFAANLAAGKKYQLSVSTAVTGQQINIRVVSPTGSVTSSTTASSLIFIANLGGRYLIELESGTLVSDYTVEIAIVDDDHVDFSDATLPTIDLAIPYSADSETAGDIDVFPFTAVAGNIYRVTSKLAEPSARVETLDGTQVDMAFYRHKDHVTYHDWKAEASGTFFLLMSPRERGSYSFTLREFQDDFTDVMSDTAPLVNIPETLAGTFDTQTDVDVVAFDILRATPFRVDSQPGSFQIFQPDGVTPLWPISDSIYTGHVTGRHFIRLESGGRLGSHSLSLTYLSEDERLSVDADDAPAEPSLAAAPSVANGSATSSVFHSATDVDVFRFDPIVGRTIEVAVTGDISGAEIRILSADGSTEVANNDLEWRSKVIWTPRSTGPYFLELQPRGSRGGNYEIETKEVPLPGLDSAFDVAQTVRIGETFTAGVESSSEVAYLAFDAEVGDLLSLTIRSDPQSVQRLRILAADGTQSFKPSNDAIWKMSSSGRHFVAIDFRYAGDVQIHLEKLEDDHGDFANEVETTVAMNSSSSGILESAFDIDIFAFQATRGQTFRFDFATTPENLHSNFVPALRILNSEQVVLAMLPSQFAMWDALEGGRYYVEVAGTKSLSYQLRIESFVSSPDLNGDKVLDSADIDAVFSAVNTDSPDPVYDINQDDQVDAQDTAAYLDRFNILTGDLNLDGRVNFTDFLGLSQGFGLSGGWSDGDFDGDGVVVFADFLLMTANFSRE